MSAPRKAWVVGKDNVLSWYGTTKEAVQSKYYSIWMGDALMYAQLTEDEEEGEQMLDSALTAAESGHNTDILLLRLHRKLSGEGLIDKKTPYEAQVPFRVCALDPVPRDSRDGRPIITNLELLTEIRTLKQQVEFIRDGQVTEEEEKPNAFMGMIGKLIENEQVQANLGNAIAGLMGRLLGGLVPVGGRATAALPALAGPVRPPRAVHGVGNTAAPQPDPAPDPAPGPAGSSDIEDADSETKLRSAIQILIQYDEDLPDDLLLLARMAQANPGQFQGLINMLRLSS